MPILQTLSALFTFGAFNLLVIGAVLIALGIVYAALRLSRTDARAGLIAVVIALGGATAFCLSSGVAAFQNTFDPRLAITAIVIGLASAVIGWLFTFRERKFPAFRSSTSFGLLFIGVGLFIAFSTLFVPVIPTQFVLPTPTRFMTDTPTPSRTLAPTRTLIATFTFTPIPSFTPTDTAIPTFTPSPSLTPSPTLPSRASITPTLDPRVTPTASTRTPAIMPTGRITATAGRVCDVQIAANVNLRAAPLAQARVVAVNPAQTVLRVISITPDRQWYQVEYNGSTAWIASRVGIPLASCAGVPTITPAP